jgi:hypothetical protein
MARLESHSRFHMDHCFLPGVVLPQHLGQLPACVDVAGAGGHGFFKQRLSPSFVAAFQSSHALAGQLAAGGDRVGGGLLAAKSGAADGREAKQ